MTYDLIVAGAGPGGATTAALAAASGLRVLLVDRARFPRDKVCGDAISGKSLDALEKLGVLDRLATSSSVGSWGVVFSGPAGADVEIPFTRRGDAVPGYVCARERFDHLLVERAVELGAELREETSVEGLIIEDHGVCGIRMTSGGGLENVRAPIVVGADGAYSVVARELGMQQLNEYHYYAGVRAYYDGIGNFRGRNYIELHFVDEAIPGYFWIFPMADGRANVGLGTLSARIKKHDLRLKDLLADAIGSDRFRERFAGARQVGKTVGWGMPLGSAPRPLSGDGWMLVGDAASLIDPFTGEGIGNAMLSGDLAAGWACEALGRGDVSAAALDGYHDAVHTALDPELNLSYTLRRLERWKWLLETVIRKAGRRPEIANTISAMFDDLGARRKLASPMFYLRVLTA